MKFKLVEDFEKRTPWNKGMKKERPNWQKCVDDDGKLYHKYLNKCNNAKKEGIKCSLSFEQYCNLLKEAGIVSSQLGFSGEGYVLARLNDSGDYTLGNCRFITQLENAKERKVSDKSREASRQNAIKMNSDRPKDIGDRIRRGMDNSPFYIEKRRQATIKAQERDALKNPSYKGEKNSQYGTYWITDGTTNKKWSDKNGPIPDGFRRGRVTK